MRFSLPFLSLFLCLVLGCTNTLVVTATPAPTPVPKPTATPEPTATPVPTPNTAATIEAGIRAALADRAGVTVGPAYTHAPTPTPLPPTAPPTPTLDIPGQWFTRAELRSTFGELGYTFEDSTRNDGHQISRGETVLEGYSASIELVGPPENITETSYLMPAEGPGIQGSGLILLHSYLDVHWPDDWTEQFQWAMQALSGTGGTGWKSGSFDGLTLDVGDRRLYHGHVIFTVRDEAATAPPAPVQQTETETEAPNPTLAVIPESGQAREDYLDARHCDRQVIRKELEEFAEDHAKSRFNDPPNLEFTFLMTLPGASDLPPGWREENAELSLPFSFDGPGGRRGRGVAQGIVKLASCYVQPIEVWYAPNR